MMMVMVMVMMMMMCQKKKDEIERPGISGKAGTTKLGRI